MPTSVAAPTEVPSNQQMQPRSLPSVRTLLFRLIFVSLVPTIIVIGAVLFYEYQTQRARSEQRTLQSARNAVQAIDDQLAQAELFALTLASNGHLANHDLAAFHEQVVQLLHDSNIGLSVVLYDDDGQQLLNTGVPFGQPLLKHADATPFDHVFTSGKVPAQNLIFRLSDGSPVVRTLAPVYAGSQVVSVLGVGLSTTKLNVALSQLNLPAGSTASIIDSSGTIAARTLDAGKLVGQKSYPEILKSKQLKLEGILETTSREGVPLMTAFSTSPNSGWAVVIGIPRQNLEAPLRQTFAFLGLGATLFLLLSFSLAWLTGNRIALSVRALRATATALGTGTLATVPATYIRETDEVAQAMVVSAHLLTTRTQQLLTANDALKERSTELGEAQHIAHIGNWKWDASNAVLFASDELHQQYGQKILLPFAEQKGTVFPDAAWEELKNAAKQTLQTKTGFSLLLPTLTEYGVPLWARVMGEAVCNADGDVTGLRGTLQDVDSDIKADIALQDSTKRYRTLFEGSPNAIVVHINGMVAFANRAAVKLFAATEPPDLVGKSLSTFVHPDFQRFVMARLLTANQLGKSAPPFELKLITVTGQTFLAQVRSAELTFEGKRYIQTYIQDLTERKRHEAQIARLQTEMDDLLTWQVAQYTVAALAHEVNQPLASASLLCEAANRMLRTDGLSSEAKADKSTRLGQTLQRIACDIERAGGVLKNLLQSVNQPDITRAPEMVNEMVAESIQTALDEGVFDYAINAQYTDDLSTVTVNRLQVLKVLLNLIHNAAQAMHEAQIADGKICISTALAANAREICISVRDQGPGISAALQQEIFQPFITTKPHGLGMGLTISRALIEANGGKLWHSQDAGAGATFHFTLPISS